MRQKIQEKQKSKAEYVERARTAIKKLPFSRFFEPTRIFPALKNFTYREFIVLHFVPPDRIPLKEIFA